MNDDVVFTVVDPADAEARAAVDTYMTEIEGHFGGTTLTVREADDVDDYREPGGVFVVGRDATGVVACGAVRCIDATVGEVKRMWVRGDHRGRGVGAALLTHLETHAARLGYERLRLDTNAVLTPAISLYESRGYAAIARYNDNPDATHFYEKRLTP